MIDDVEVEDVYVQEATSSEELKKASDRVFPIDFGFEIEQPEEWIDRFPALLRTFVWNRDGSSPMETKIPPSKVPSLKVKEFTDKVISLGADEWEWTNQYYVFELAKGCGSHIHLRVREDLVMERIKSGVYRNIRSLEDAWSVTYNTILEVTPFLTPILAWYDKYSKKFIHRFRRSIYVWAEYDIAFMTNIRMSSYLSEDYVGHPATAIALNRSHSKKPLTIEVRLAESPPQVTMYYCAIIGRIVDKCLKRGESPILANRRDFYDEFRDLLYIEAYSKDLSVYQVLSSIKNVSFREGFEIPGLRNSYPTALDVYKDILRAYTPDAMAYRRLFYFFYNEMEPYKNWRMMWKLFIRYKEFYWEQPYVRDEHIRKFYDVYRVRVD